MEWSLVIAVCAIALATVMFAPSKASAGGIYYSYGCPSYSYGYAYPRYGYGRGYPRYGYRKIFDRLKGAGWKVSRERVRLLRCTEGLRVPRKSPKRRRPGTSTIVSTS